MQHTGHQKNHAHNQNVLFVPHFKRACLLGLVIAPLSCLSRLLGGADSIAGGLACTLGGSVFFF